MVQFESNTTTFSRVFGRSGIYIGGTQPTRQLKTPKMISWGGVGKVKVCLVESCKLF